MSLSWGIRRNYYINCKSLSGGTFNEEPLRTVSAHEGPYFTAVSLYSTFWIEPSGTHFPERSAGGGSKGTIVGDPLAPRSSNKQCRIGHRHRGIWALEIPPLPDVLQCPKRYHLALYLSHSFRSTWECVEFVWTINSGEMLVSVLVQRRSSKIARGICCISHIVLTVKIKLLVFNWLVLIQQETTLFRYQGWPVAGLWKLQKNPLRV